MFTDEARSVLANGVAKVELVTPAQIRCRGVARTRYRVAAGVVASLVVVSGAGCARARPSLDGPNRPVTTSPSTYERVTPPSESPPVPSEPASPPLSSRPPTNSTIPDEVLLRPADLGGALVNESDLGFWRDGRRIPPRPCAGATYSSDARRTAERAVQSMIQPEPGQNQNPNVVVEYVALYDADGAQTFMTELRAAVNRCPGGGTPASPAWTRLGNISAGDDSLLIRYTLVGGYHGDPDIKTDQYLAVIRIGRVIMVLGSLGWEISSGNATTARVLAPVAADRLRPLT